MFRASDWLAKMLLALESLCDGDGRGAGVEVDGESIVL